MRGQRLFIRPIEPSDSALITAFFENHTGRATSPDCGLIGKLVGNLVAVVGMQITADAVRIDDIVVAPDLRKKRVARLMLDDLEQLAARIDRKRIVMSHCPTAEPFLSRVGFEREGDDWVREVRK